MQCPMRIITAVFVNLKTNMVGALSVETVYHAAMQSATSSLTKSTELKAQDKAWSLPPWEGAAAPPWNRVSSGVGDRSRSTFDCTMAIPVGTTVKSLRAADEVRLNPEESCMAQL